MRKIPQVFLEALVIGLATTIVGLIVSLLMTQFDKTLTFEFEPRSILKFFLTGALLHIGFEYLGLNEKYCKMFIGQL